MSHQKDTVSEEVLSLLGVVDTDIPFEITQDHPKWFLCTLSEKKLDIAAKLTAAMRINDHFILKFNGILSALCLKSFRASNGQIFLEGVWYSPASQQSRDILRDNFDVGVSSLTLQRTQWELLRAVDTDRKYFRKHPMSQAEFLDKLRIAVEAFPPFFSQRITDEYGDTRTRKQYREYFFEEDW